MANNFLPFCPTDTGTNLLTQSEYALASDRTNGNQPGVASSKLNNKAIRQATFVTSQLAQWISNVLGADTLDNGDAAAFLAQIYSSFAPNASPSIKNLSFTTSVGSSALTIALKTQSGSDASSTNPVYLGFRNSTITNGGFNQRSVTGALSLTVSSGSTLGTASGVASYLYLYALDNAGTVELAICNGLVDEGSLQTTTAEGGAGAADSANVLYSTTARSNVPVRLIGRILITEATAGTWSSNATELSVAPFNRFLPIFGEFTANFNQDAGSGGTNTSVTLQYTKIGNQVFLTFPAKGNLLIGATSTDLTAAAATVPTIIRPAANFGGFGIRIVYNNVGDTRAGLVTIGSSGAIVINRDNATNWTATTPNCGWISYTFVYTVA